MATRTAQLIAKLTDQVSGPAKGMSNALKGTASALDALKAKAGRIDAFRQASKILDDASQRMKVAQQNLRKIKADMEAAGDGGKKFASALRSAEREVQAATNAFKRQGQEVRAMRSALQEAGVPLKQLAAHERDLRNEIDRTTAALKKQEAVARTALKPGAGGRLNRLTDGIEAERLNRRMLRQGGGGGGATGALAGAGIARFGAAAAGIGGGAYVVGEQVRRSVRTFAELETAYKDLAITADQSDATVGASVEGFRQQAAQFGSSTKEMVETAKTFVAAGLDYKTAVAAVVPTIKTAKASFGELPDTAKAGVAAISNLEIAVTDLPEAFDRMAKAGKEGNVELANLARILPAVAASGSKLGLKGLSGLTDITSGLEILGKVTATPDEAANRLQNLFEKVTADETVKAFKKVSKAAGQTIDLEKEIAKGAKNGETALAVTLRLAKQLTQGNPFRINELFGDMQARAAVEALLKFEDEFNAIRGRINRDSKGLVDKDFERATGRLAADFEKLGAAWDRLSGRIGEGLAPGLSQATQQLTRFLDRLDQGDTTLQRMLKRITPDGPDGKAEGGGDPLGRLSTSILERLDPKFGKSLVEQAEMDRVAEQVRKEGERRSLFGRPAELEDQIRRRQAVLERSKEVAGGRPGIQASMAREQVGKSEGEIVRLQGELAKAWDAIGELRAREKREGGTFGLGGPTGKDAAGIGPGRFGLGLHGTPNLAPRNVPLPPVRPPELQPVQAKVDASQVESLGTAADAAKGKLSALDMTVTPHVQQGDLVAMESTIDRIIEKARSLGSVISAAKSQAASVSLPNVGGGGRTGRVAQAFANSPSAGEA